MSKNLLITGGAGFIGSCFVRAVALRFPDYRVVNLDKLTYAGNLENLASVEDGPNYTFVRGDICDAALVSKIFDEHSIDAVVHLAAESHVDRSIIAAEEFLRTNVMGTHTLLEAARQRWKGTSRGPFVHVSTDEVYGSIEEGRFTEESPYRPNSPYAASKAASDHLARAYFKTYGVPVVITNCSNNYGPHQFPEKLIPLMVLSAVEGERLPVYGDGGNVRDWLHVTDHAEALTAALHKGRPGETYNIGGSSEWKNIDIVKEICRLLDELSPRPRSGKGGEVAHESLIEFVQDRPGHDRRYAVDPSKALSELGWEPQRTFKEGLRETVEWYLANRGWSDRVRGGEYRDYYEKNYVRR